MNLSSAALDNIQILASGHHEHNLSRKYDTAGWTFHTEPVLTPNLAFLPILALIFLVLCCCLKVYTWYNSDSGQWKARGDVELGDEAEGSAADEGVSLYDTVNSGRLVGNGFAHHLTGIHPYHDTISSYKSLLMQRADGSQYDSVQSYKAFLQKVTQNKELDVEVKLLENYPIRSKSAEHCVLLEEESSERSGDVTTRSPLSKQLYEQGSCPHMERKKRHRRASGDLPLAMRKRSASNPSSQSGAGPAGSLPSIRYTLSSDSEEDSQQSFRMDRRKLWVKRKKMSPSASGSKIFQASTLLRRSGAEQQSVQKRRRHYSADSARRPNQAAKFSNDSCHCANSEDPITEKTGQKLKRPIHLEMDESSSENPQSSHSSCNSDVQSDVLQSESDDDTKQNTLLSNASDDHTLENDVFLSLDSGAELASSSELLETSPKRPLVETKRRIARAKEAFFLNKDIPTFLALPVPTAENCKCLQKLSEKSSADIAGGVSLTQQQQWAGHSPRIVQRFHVTFVNPDLSGVQALEASAESRD